MRQLALATVLLLAACGAPVPEPAPAPEPGPVLPDEFPHGMKGLSMYGYVQDGRTWFTLITGTNRLKSFEELAGAEPLLGDDGWVRVRVQGVEAARDLLRRVPDDEDVMVTSIRHVSVAQNTVPDGIGEPDEAVLRDLDSPR